MASALLVTLATPATWALALAAFLIRGGILLVIVPIVVLPTAVGLGNLFGATLVSLAFGSIPVEVIVATGLVAAGVVAWVVLGGWLAAGLEAEGARIVARDEDVAAFGGAAPRRPPSAPSMGRIAGRILAARLIASVPLAIVLALGTVRLIFVTYRELTAPLDVATPIVLRVLRGSPEVVVAVVVAWMVAEILGAIAARRIVLGGMGVGAALRQASAAAFRHPVASLTRFWLPTFLLFLVLIPSALAAGATWQAAGTALDEDADPVRLLVTVVLFVGLWAVGLVLIAVVCAWRAAVWTIADVTRQGTFGGSTHRRPGHWRPHRSSATLWSGRPMGRSRRRGER
jgi:hypothetical protein